jgi:four helix bundle protein
MVPQELRDRTAEQARRVAIFARTLLDEAATRDSALQLMRAASSAAANYRAATRARSHAEFTAKIGVALEEADEAVFWLAHLQGIGITIGALDELHQEALEIVAILAAARRTSLRNDVRNKLSKPRTRPR